MKNETLQIIIKVFKESFSIVYIIIAVLFFIISLGLGFILFDSVSKSDYKDDWTLMEEWRKKEIKKMKKEKKKNENKNN